MLQPLHRNTEGEVLHQDFVVLVAQLFISKKCSLLLGSRQHQSLISSICVSMPLPSFPPELSHHEALM